MAKLKILVVEDSKITARLIQKSLDRIGYTVSALVTSGEEAIKKAEELKPDLVLMDVLLEGKMDGIEAAEIIHSQLNIPIVYLTAHADKKILERAKRTEPFGFIVKPFEDIEINSNIEIAIYRHRLESEHRRLEKALKESEERFRGLSEASFEGIVIHGKGKIVDASNRFAEMFGYSHSEVIGKTAKDFIVPENLDSVLEKIEIRDEKPYLSLGLRKDGSTFPLEIHSKQALHHGKEVRITSVRDISERKEAENKLNQKTKLMQLLQEITITANEASSIENAMNICLKNICSFTGWPIGHVYEIDPKRERLISTKIWHIENEERFKAFREVTEVTSFDRGVGLPGQILKNGKPAWVIDVTKDPNFPRAELAKGIGVKAAFGFPVLEGEKVVAVLEFYSEKTAEPDKSLLEALANLAVQLGRVTERKRAEQDLKNSMAHLDEFSYIVSHDLKAPLRAINSLAGWIAEDYKEILDDKGREWLERLLGRTEHMNNLITGILRYSRIDKNKPTKVTLSSSQIVSKVIKSLEHSYVNVQIEGGLPDIYYNETQLEQVFQNLIGNAIKHIGKPEGKVVISYLNTNKFHQFCVKDNGVGIEEEHFERIFKIFQRLNQDKEGDSTGIGLALVKKIVSRNGGAVWVESEKGEGSAFYFTVPK